MSLNKNLGAWRRLKLRIVEIIKMFVFVFSFAVAAGWCQLLQEKADTIVCSSTNEWKRCVVSAIAVLVITNTSHHSQKKLHYQKLRHYVIVPADSEVCILVQSTDD